MVEQGGPWSNHTAIYRVLEYLCSSTTRGTAQMCKFMLRLVGRILMSLLSPFVVEPIAPILSKSERDLNLWYGR
jgi:hypothetical protein